MEKEAVIYVAGHTGLVGSALVRALRRGGWNRLVYATHREVDLCEGRAVREFFERERPSYVMIAAARVGGIEANRKSPYQFLRENVLIQDNVLTCCHAYGVKKTLFLGSSCIYPRECPQPMKEEYLLTGKLEPTNEGYALAKIVGIREAQYLRRQYGMKSVCAMPCNVYGLGDTFDLERAHVLSALVRKFVDAAEAGARRVECWGTGGARREFLHVDDLARACIMLMERYEGEEIINVGSGSDVTISELAEMVKKAVGYKGEIVWDHGRPDGMPRKCLDVTRITELGFRPEIGLAEGIGGVVEEYRKKRAQGAIV